jgi:hypothetical protein
MIHADTLSHSASLPASVDQPGRRCLPEALAKLRAAKIVLVRFEYAGQSDYRRVKPVTFHDASGRVAGQGVSRATQQEVGVFFHEMLELRFPEWAMAEGSRGEFEWNVGADELVHRHQWRVIAYEDVAVFGLGSAPG